MPYLTKEAQGKLTDILRDAAHSLPAPAFVVGTADGVLYSGRQGVVDILDKNSPAPDEDTIYAFYSTTKLLTSVSRISDKPGD
jgi:hypothetical protein